jgi:hypothetical protein
MEQKTKIKIDDLLDVLKPMAIDIKLELEKVNLEISDDTAVMLAMKVIDGMNIQASYLPSLIDALKGKTKNGLVTL